DGVGLEHVPGDDRVVLRPVLPVHPLPADDRHLRDADAPARGARPPGQRRHGGGRGPATMTAPTQLPPYGLVAEFDSAQALLRACEQTRDAGYTRAHAYSPSPVGGLIDALGRKPTLLPLVVLLGGVIGGLSGYLLQWYTSTISYPLNVAGKPYHSWPMFIPVTFECTVLGAALAAVIG